MNGTESENRIQWHIMYKARGIPQYEVFNSRERYRDFMEYLKSEGCTVERRWTRDIFGRDTPIED